MKGLSLVLAASLFLTATQVAAQKPLVATTEDGQRVILSQDGTWKYAPAPTAAPQAGTAAFTRPSTATSVLTLNKGAATVRYDPAEWTVDKQESVNKTSFEHKSGDLYGMVIAERLEMTSETLKELALKNAKNAATSVSVLQEDQRVVNGTEVVHLLFEATIQGALFTFEGYYYAGPAGTIQVLTYTGKNLYPQYQDQIQGFLNGLEVAPKPQP